METDGKLTKVIINFHFAFYLTLFLLDTHIHYILIAPENFMNYLNVVQWTIVINCR